jgi:hypothetical protein
MKPAFEELKEDFSDFNWVSVNIKDDPAGYTQKFGVTTIPAIGVETTDGVKLYSGTDIMMFYKFMLSFR